MVVYNKCCLRFKGSSFLWSLSCCKRVASQGRFDCSLKQHKPYSSLSSNPHYIYKPPPPIHIIYCNVYIFSMAVTTAHLSRHYHGALGSTVTIKPHTDINWDDIDAPIPVQYINLSHWGMQPSHMPLFPVCIILVHRVHTTNNKQRSFFLGRINNQVVFVCV